MNTEAVRGAFLEEYLGGPGRVLSFLAIAEGEIRAVFKTRKDEPAGLFNTLVPPNSMIDKDPKVYEAHARELIARATAGNPTDYATRAEALIAILTASERAPLQTLGYAVARRLFVHVYPEKAGEFPEPPEPWPGAIDEEIAKLCKKMSVKGRNGK